MRNFLVTVLTALFLSTPAFAVTELNDKTFKTTVAAALKEKKLVAIKFYATWCGPCKTYAPMYEKAETALKGKITFYQIDVDKAPQAAGGAGVRSIPFTLLINGKTGDVFTGTGIPPSQEAFEKTLKDIAK